MWGYLATMGSVYDYTSIARPVDPAYPTNRAVLALVPVAAVLGGVWQALGLGTATVTGGAANAALVAFGTWALTRELAPDDNAAAFVSMAVGMIAFLAFGTASVMPLFVALFQVRIVNRSTGNAATIADTVFVLALSLWAAYAYDQPLLAASGAAAFLLDAVLAPATARQIIAAVVCLFVPFLWSGSLAVPRLYPVPIPVNDLLFLSISVAGYSAAFLGMKPVRSLGDATGAPLSRVRVRGGMIIGGFVAIQSLTSAVADKDLPDWWMFSCLAGVALGRLSAAVASAVRRLRR